MDVRRDTQKNYKLICMLSLVSIFASCLKQLIYVIRNQYQGIDLLYMMVETSLLLLFGFIFYQRDLGNPKPKPQVIKVVTRKAEGFQHEKHV